MIIYYLKYQDKFLIFILILVKRHSVMIQ